VKQQQDQNNIMSGSARSAEQHTGALVIGDRVIVPSTGQKGTLRYWGTTDFKEGLWAGIELDDNGGKNDGSVQGYVLLPIFLSSHHG
jgi:hypothetical protein